jgi:hypothetical protein
MEQRPLRLGDIVDDYCPRERRITNHAIVAIVETVIRQTRCTTCDSEHVYKAARIPRRRKGEPDIPGQAPPPPSDSIGDAVDAVDAVEAADSRALAVGPADENGATDPAETRDEPSSAVEGAEVMSDEQDDREDRGDQADEGWWPAHRRLIRATLPRVEGDTPPPRPIPEFTMHQRQTRGGNFRGGQGWQGGNGQGGRASGFRSGRPGPGQGGDANGNGQGAGQERPGGRRGRSGRHRGQNKRPR